MSTVSSGGRRNPPKEFRIPPRNDIRQQQHRIRGRGYSQSDIGDPFIPRFSAVANEGVKMAMPQDEDWPENTTVLTAVTSDSYTEGEPKVYEQPTGRIVGRRISRLLWLMAAFIISFLAIISAPVMIALPWFLTQLHYEFPPIICEVDCQGYVLLLAIKTVLLFVALWALFWRRAVADLPRLYFARACLTAFTLFILFAFWLFYIVRIVLEQYSNYSYVVTYSLSLLDALLYTHYISLIVLELRKVRAEYTITIVRDPDGEAHTISVGILSLQEAAIQVLRFYETSFSTFNDQLDKAKHSSSRMRMGGPHAGPGFKMYDIEGLGGQETISEVNARHLLEAASRRRGPGHNEMLQDEMEWERKMKKRKYRLLAVAEDAFAHVQGVAENNQTATKNALGAPMDSLSAAKNVFAWIQRPLNRYLKTTRQHQKHGVDTVTKHIERCLSMKLSHRTFLQRFFSDRFPPDEVVSESKWSIISDEQASVPIQHCTTFLLRSHNKNETAGIQLLCTVSSLPFYNLTEQPRSSISKFALRISSESSV